ncbi:MAG: helix-turn-helix transcriptional regulator, partial [Acidaminococcaceae bacterium]|nr:helix-turn-helix transcriptional regulator [Acidaminococcaceae bacterium]
ISQTHLSNIENGRVTVNLRFLVRAANVFDCTLEVFSVGSCRNYKGGKRIQQLFAGGSKTTFRNIAAWQEDRKKWPGLGTFCSESTVRIYGKVDEKE